MKDPVSVWVKAAYFYPATWWNSRESDADFLMRDLNVKADLNRNHVFRSQNTLRSFEAAGRICLDTSS